MRIHLKLSKNTKLVPYSHQHKLVGAIHKWLGKNDLHGKISLYSFSRLQGGSSNKKGLDFKNGANWFVSFYNDDFLKDIVFGLMKDKPEIFNGMQVETVTIQETPDFTNTTYFKIASPILIKRNDGGFIKHFLYTDKEAPELLTETLRSKMQQVGLTDDSLKIEFDTNYSKASAKLIDYKGIKNKTSWCPVIIHRKPETKAFAWNVGVGEFYWCGFWGVNLGFI